MAILSQNRPEFVDAYFGVPMAGMGLTFLNYRLAPRELSRIVADAEASVLLVEDAYAEVIAGIRDELTSVKTVVVIGGADPAGIADVHYDELLAAASDDDADGRRRRARPRVADLHERHDGHAEGSDAQPSQPPGGVEQLDDPQQQLGRGRRLVDDVPAVPRRRRSG